MSRALKLGLAAAAGTAGAVAYLGSRSRLRSAEHVELPALVPGASLREAFDGLPGATRAEVRLLRDGPEAWAARWQLMDEARESLDVAYYVLDDDVYGVAFLGHLLERAREGVRVRLLLDGFGNRMGRGRRGSRYLETLRSTPGIHVRIQRPMRDRIAEALLHLSVVPLASGDHRKILVADRRRAIVGSRNVAAGYFDASRTREGFSDTDLLLEGEDVCDAIRDAFVGAFASWGSHESHHHRRPSVPGAQLLDAFRAADGWMREGIIAPDVAGRIEEAGLPWAEELRARPWLRSVLQEPVPVVARLVPVRVLHSHPRRPDPGNAPSRAIGRLLEAARRELLVLSAYVVPVPCAVEQLRRAGERGMALRVYTNGPTSSSEPVTQAPFLEAWPELLAQVPGLRLWTRTEAPMLHDKVAVFDRVLSLVGTYNFDPLSIMTNGEIVVALWSEELAAELVRMADSPLGDGPRELVEYTIERDERGRPVRDESGRVVVRSGPEGQRPRSQWLRAWLYWAALRAVGGPEYRATLAKTRSKRERASSITSSESAALV